MNWQHLQAFLWLRWRIRSNQMKRAGPASVIIAGAISFIEVLAAASTFLAGLLAGLLLLPRASAPVVMLVWDGVIVVFLFFWMSEMMIELQRSELLSLDKFLHLPVSLTGVFLINYVGSLFTFSMILFLPAMIGLAIGLVFSKGAIMLSLFPVVAGFFLVVTALTHQFRGWLASLMENKRRRRTIIMVATFVFVLISQIPNLVFWTSGPSRQNAQLIREETGKLDRLLAERKIDHTEYESQVEAIRKKYGQARRDRRPRLEEAARIGRMINLAVPLGWLPYSAMTSFQGTALPAMLAGLGLGLIGAASLRRSYGTTMRLYTGQFTSRRPAPVTAERSQDRITGSASGLDRGRPSALFVERRLPWISEHASAIAVMSFRSLMRAPESKTMLLTPLIFTVVFGGMFLRVSSNPSEFARPLMAASVMGTILLGLLQITGNQFGFDRSGFRAFVLSPASRKEILLGKNLAVLPFGLVFGTAANIFLQFAFPMRIDHFFAVLAQTGSMCLVFCVLSNFLSVFAPAAVPSGSLKPPKPKGIAILVHLVFFFVVFPMGVGTALFPLGIEFFLSWWGVLSGFPVYLLLALAELAVVAYLYPFVLTWQGQLLHAREQKILEIVTAKAE